MGGKTGGVVLSLVVGVIGFILVKTANGWGDLFGWAMMILGALGLFGTVAGNTESVTKVYCADCGRYLGPVSNFTGTCPSCGATQWIYKDGV